MIARLRLLLRLSAAHFSRHRARVALTCLGIALGVAAVTAVLALSRSIVDTFQASVVRGAGAAQLQVSNGTAGLDRDLVEMLASVPGVAATGATVQHHVVLPALGRRVTVFGVELGRDEAYREVQTGPDVADIPDGLRFVANTDSIALPAALLTDQRWNLGDTVDVIGPSGPRPLTIRGRLHPTGVLSAFGDSVALMDLDAAQLHFGNPARVHWIDLVVAPSADVAEVQTGVTELLEGRGTVAPPVARGRRIETMLSLLRVLLTGTSIVAMLVGVFLIHHTLSTSYRQRRADLVRLRALGMSRRWLVAYLVAEATLLGGVASVIGLVAGMGFWRLATRDFSTTVSTLFVPIPTPHFALSFAEFASVLALGTCAVVMGALTPAIAMLRVRPLESNEVATPTGHHPGVLAFGAVALMVTGVFLTTVADRFGFFGQVVIIGAMATCAFVASTLLVPVLLEAVRRLLDAESGSVWTVLSRWTWHQVSRRRLHTATTIGALAAGVAFAIGLTVLLGSYRGAFRDWFEQSFGRGDVLVNAGPTVSLLGGQTVDGGLAGEIGSLDTVASVLRLRFLEVQYRGQPIVVQAMSEELLARTYPEFSGGDDAVLISDTLAEHFDLHVGDRLTLPAPVRPLSLRVGGVVPDYVLHLGSVKLGWRTFTEHFDDDRVSLLFVDATPGAAPADLKRLIDGLLGARYDVSVLTSAELRHLADHLVDRSVALTYWLQVLAALVAVAAMVNATSASIIDREDELRTWRALGLRRSRLVRLLVGEAAAVGVSGSVLGLLAGVVLGFTLTTFIARAVAGFRLDVHWPAAAMVALPVLSTIAAAAAAAVVALRWTRGRAMTSASVASH